MPEPSVQTLAGTVIRRAEGGVGKRMGGSIYMHRLYVRTEVLELAPPGFDFAVVREDHKSITFVQSPDFDTADEPTVGDSVLVCGLDDKRWRKGCGQIYHHKWLFVRDDYPWFDVAAAVERSRRWLALDGVDMRRIGWRSYWEREVVPRIPEE
jgi:hypothetical protein